MSPFEAYCADFEQVFILKNGIILVPRTISTSTDTSDGSASLGQSISLTAISNWMVNSMPLISTQST